MSEDEAFEILPGQGAGPLRLLDSPERVRGLFGDPAQSDEEQLDGFETLSWHYDSPALSLHFERDDEWQLCAIDVSALEASVFGVRPLGLRIDEADQVFGERARLTRDTELSTAERQAFVLCEKGAPGPGSVVLWFGKDGCDSIEVCAEETDGDEDESA